MNTKASFSILKQSPISKRHNGELYNANHSVHPLTEIYLLYFQNIDEDEMKKNFSEASSLIMNSRSTKIAQWFVAQPYFLSSIHPVDAALMKSLQINPMADVHQKNFFDYDEPEKIAQNKKYGILLGRIMHDEHLFKYNNLKEFYQKICDSKEDKNFDKICENALLAIDKKHRSPLLQQIVKDFADSDNAKGKEVIFSLLNAGVKHQYITKEEVSLLFSQEFARIITHQNSNSILLPKEDLHQIKTLQENGFNFNFEVVQKMTPECFAEKYVERCITCGEIYLVNNLLNSDNPPVKELKNKALIDKIPNKFNENSITIDKINKFLTIQEAQIRKNEIDNIVSETVEKNRNQGSVTPSHSFKL